MSECLGTGERLHVWGHTLYAPERLQTAENVPVQTAGGLPPGRRVHLAGVLNSPTGTNFHNEVDPDDGSQARLQLMLAAQVFHAVFVHAEKSRGVESPLLPEACASTVSTHFFS